MENKEYKLREVFWTPYDQMKEHIGKGFKVVRELTEKEVDAEILGELFVIKLEDGEEIEAWFEEIYKDSCIVNGVTH